MILSFRVRNFRSFAGEATLDLTAPGFRTNRPRADSDWPSSVLPVVAIYGPNASGKTTVLDGIWTLCRAMRSSQALGLHQPHAHAVDQAVEYEVDLVANGVRYWYVVHAAPWGIAHESLHSAPLGTRRLVFARSQPSADGPLNFQKGASLTGPTHEVLKITRPTGLLLANAHRYDHPALAPVARALVASVGVGHVSFRDRQDERVLQRVVMEMVEAPAEQIDLVRGLLRAADLGIDGIEVRREELPEEVVSKVRKLVEALREGDEPLDHAAVPTLRDVVLFRHQGPGGTAFDLPIHRESSGTLTWLTIAWHALTAIRSGRLLLVDELDASLHPELARYLVTLFKERRFNPLGAQLVFTTHDVSLLGNSPTRVLDPENVWFTEKDATGTSTLFCLDEFDHRPGNNSEKRYMAGRFGALPSIDDHVLLQFLDGPDRTEGTTER